MKIKDQDNEQNSKQEWQGHEWQGQRAKMPKVQDKNHDAEVQKPRCWSQRITATMRKSSQRITATMLKYNQWINQTHQSICMVQRLKYDDDKCLHSPTVMNGSTTQVPSMLKLMKQDPRMNPRIRTNKMNRKGKSMARLTLWQPEDQEDQWRLTQQIKNLNWKNKQIKTTNNEQ